MILFNFVNYCVILILGFIFLTEVRAVEVVAKLVILSILVLTSFILAF